MTVDSFAGPKDPYAKQAKLNSGFIAQDTVRGVLSSVTESWIILQEGSNKNWIPRDKVLLLRVGP